MSLEMKNTIYKIEITLFFQRQPVTHVLILSRYPSCRLSLHLNLLLTRINFFVNVLLPDQVTKSSHKTMSQYIWLTEANLFSFFLSWIHLLFIMDFFPEIVFQLEFKCKIQLDMKYPFQKIRLTTAPATVMSRCVELCTGSTRTTTQGARSFPYIILF